MLTSTGLHNYAIRPHNGRSFPLSSISAHEQFCTGYSEVPLNKMSLSEHIDPVISFH